VQPALAPFAVITLALLAACPARDVAEVAPQPTKEDRKDIPLQQRRDIDILFVIDNSGSMLEEQTSLVDNFHRFIEVLERIDGGLPSVHLGVISSDLGAGPYDIPSGNCFGAGDNGRLQSAPRLPGCAPPDGAFIRDVVGDDGSRERNYTGALADTFACIAALGIDGCGFEQHLEAMRRALNGSNPENAGFLRPDALLGVVFIADEDDCSTEDHAMFDPSQTSASDPLGPLHSYRCTEFGVVCDPDTPRLPGVYEGCRPREDSPYMFGVQQYVDFLRGLKPDPEMVIVAGIVAPPTPFVVELEDRPSGEPWRVLQPSCSTPGAGDADPGVRFHHFLQGFPGRSTATTICDEDLSDALVLIAELLREALGNACIEGDIDLQPETPGVQYDCAVTEVRFAGEEREQETVVPPCDAEGLAVPCWTFEPDPECDRYPTGLAVVVERGGAPAPPGTRLRVRCATR
jgi:hypothetical protein